MSKMSLNATLTTCINAIKEVSDQTSRNLEMPGNPRYQPEILKPFLGYDQWALWLATVEIMWLHFLRDIRFIKSDGMDEAMIGDFFRELTTCEQDQMERTTNHDINALIALMRKSHHVPSDLNQYIHFGLTSYDTIETARALQVKVTWEETILPSAKELDVLWREKIGETVEVLQMGRTHLQDALPVTTGFWLSVIHERFSNSIAMSHRAMRRLTGKVSGAVGTSAATKESGIAKCFYAQPHIGHTDTVESSFLHHLDLAPPSLSTQIVPPENMVRFYTNLTLISGALAQLGNDCRILQSSAYGELISVSSTSSTMAHKKANPIAAENLSGMHTTLLGEFWKILQNLSSDLQRDLCGSSPARDYIAVMVYLQQQILTATRLIKNLKIDTERCNENFEKSGRVVTSELLLLALQKAGVRDAHTIVNKEIAPLAMEQLSGLRDATNDIAMGRSDLATAMTEIPEEMWNIIENPELYIGNAAMISKEQSLKPISV